MGFGTSIDLPICESFSARRDTDDEELSEDDVNDPALLRELEGLSGGGGDESHAPSSRGGHRQQTAAEPLVYASANLTAVIDERIANYTQVRVRVAFDHVSDICTEPDISFHFAFSLVVVQLISVLACPAKS